MPRSLFAVPLLIAVPAAAEAPKPTKAAGERMVCKGFTRTGSLVARDRICKTQAEWDWEREMRRSAGAIDGCRTRAEPDPLKPGGGCL